MPKQRITKEMVVAAAFDLARQDGMERVTVKSIAQKLNCSVQPIYSYCDSMDGLRNDVYVKTRGFIQEYVASRIDKNDLFRSTGQAYIQLAKEEPHLLNLFILQKRENITSLDDLYRAETNPQVARSIAEQLNIPPESARQLHLHMLIYTMGLGTIFAVSKPGIPTEEIYSQQELAYDAFLKAALERKSNQ